MFIINYIIKELVLMKLGCEVTFNKVNKDYSCEL